MHPVFAMSCIMDDVQWRVFHTPHPDTESHPTVHLHESLYMDSPLSCCCVRKPGHHIAPPPPGDTAVPHSSPAFQKRLGTRPAAASRWPTTHVSTAPPPPPECLLTYLLAWHVLTCHGLGTGFGRTQAPHDKRLGGDTAHGRMHTSMHTSQMCLPS
jgi:hypothetical protein